MCGMDRVLYIISYSFFLDFEAVLQISQKRLCKQSSGSDRYLKSLYFLLNLHGIDDTLRSVQWLWAIQA